MLIEREEAMIQQLLLDLDGPGREALQQELSQIRRALRLLGFNPHPDDPEDHISHERTPLARRNRNYL
jgi:hypothetical protein